jgi:hypothetical protein
MKQMLVLLMLVCIFCSGCGVFDDNSAEGKQKEKTEEILKEINAQIGMPAIQNFQEKKLSKMIFELRDREDLITYAYIVNHMTGELVFIGKCLGYGLPYSVQYTNPMKKVYGASGNVTLPQADPNGLYMPQGLSATFLLMIDPDTGEGRPVYVEPEIIVSPIKLHKEGVIQSSTTPIFFGNEGMVSKDCMPC